MPAAGTQIPLRALVELGEARRGQPPAGGVGGVEGRGGLGDELREVGGDGGGS
ncbi:hypothetical protein NLM24_41320 [Nocardia zapadnayensis]|nr:hypothetical protein [Nocardia zapadnayensis]MCX0276951.1 hypothetical protein [Nocardia zapadnayensis]